LKFRVSQFSNKIQS